MRERLRFLGAVVLWSFSFLGLGCNHTQNVLLPLHKEVLVYPLPMDLTYLRTLDAVQKHKDWELDTTDKEKGIINIRNMRYSSFVDADLRRISILLKRVGPHKTSVQLAPESQAVFGGDEILKLIKQYLSREVSARAGG